MARRYRSEPIEVVAAVDGAPAEFRWRGRRYAVRVVIASWVEAVPWWAGESPGTRAGGQCRAPRQAWRVEAAPAAPRTGSAGVYDLYRDPGDRERSWVLERVFD